MGRVPHRGADDDWRRESVSDAVRGPISTRGRGVALPTTAAEDRVVRRLEGSGDGVCAVVVCWRGGHVSPGMGETIELKLLKFSYL